MLRQTSLHSFTHWIAVYVVLAGVHNVSAQPTMSVTRVANGYSRPVFATTSPGDPDRMFVIEQSSGAIEILNPTTGAKNPNPFLVVAGLSTGGERGLLGLAFHPDYASNGKFYVNMTGGGGDTFIREYQRSNADLANTNSAKTILTFDQPESNHNGGWIGFGPDGLLYVATGDGGGGNDPNNHSQTIENDLLGKMLRIDVNSDGFPNEPNRNYAIPANNPFADAVGDDEIFHFGLRNPWRASFDRETGDMYIGDVGQGRLEEIDVAPAGVGGINFGWRPREGTIATPNVGGAKPPGAIDPVYDYTRGNGDLQGNSVTGGYVYRGPIKALQGHYFFGDFATQRIWSLKWDESPASTFDGQNFTAFTDWTDILVTDTGSIGGISSFGEDELGNLYVVDYGGEVFRIDAATFTTCDYGGGTGSGCELLDLDRLYANIGGTNSIYDLNADGIVDDADIATWLQQASAADNPAKDAVSHVYAVGDVDLDGKIDSTDLGILLNNFGNGVSLGWGAGNLNGDANIDSDDLGMLLNNFAFVSQTTAVPEPDNAWLLFGMFVPAFVLRWERHRMTTFVPSEPVKP